MKKRRKRILLATALVIVMVVLALPTIARILTSGAIGMALLGNGRPRYDGDAELSLPPSASRAMSFTSGFVDHVSYRVFTADEIFVREYAEKLAGVPVAHFEDWSEVDATSFPNFSEETDREYWDIESVSEGKSFDRSESGGGLRILVDTGRWRIFVYDYST